MIEVEMCIIFVLTAFIIGLLICGLAKNLTKNFNQDDWE